MNDLSMKLANNYNFKICPMSKKKVKEFIKKQNESARSGNVLKTKKKNPLKVETRNPLKSK